jgi:hypothetical protein
MIAAEAEAAPRLVAKVNDLLAGHNPAARQLNEKHPTGQTTKKLDC